LYYYYYYLKLLNDYNGDDQTKVNCKFCTLKLAIGISSINLFLNHLPDVVVTVVVVVVVAKAFLHKLLRRSKGGKDKKWSSIHF